MPLDREQRLALRRQLYPEIDDLVFGTVEWALDRYIQPGALVLDAGSGTGTWVLDRYAERVCLLVGADIEPPAQAGKAVPILADLAALPFASASFHVVLCYNVIEHLADPARALRELARVLVPGGVLVFKTPNVRAPITALSRLLPLLLRRRVKRGLGVGAEHVFPTYYRCNTAAELDRRLREAGLVAETLLTVDQTFDYLYFTRLSYVLGLLYSRALARLRWQGIGNSIIGVYRKPRAGAK